jgi:hypothetical protein
MAKAPAVPGAKPLTPAPLIATGEQLEAHIAHDFSGPERWAMECALTESYQAGRDAARERIAELERERDEALQLAECPGVSSLKDLARELAYRAQRIGRLTAALRRVRAAYLAVPQERHEMESAQIEVESALADSGPTWPVGIAVKSVVRPPLELPPDEPPAGWISPEDAERLREEHEEAVTALGGSVEMLVAERDALRAELLQEHENYNTLTAMLQRRFPPNPDGSLPDFKIEDVLRENEQLRAEVAGYKRGIESRRRELPAMSAPDAGFNAP